MINFAIFLGICFAIGCVSAALTSMQRRSYKAGVSALAEQVIRDVQRAGKGTWSADWFTREVNAAVAKVNRTGYDVETPEHDYHSEEE